MSNYFRVIKTTYNPYDGEWQDAIWHYNFKGYLCLVEFSGGRFWNPNSEPLRIKGTTPKDLEKLVSLGGLKK